MARMLPFNFEMPISFFEKASAPEGERRRIGGIASLETKDKQNEELLARGLDFSEFVTDGWFNDNHSKKTSDVVGYPIETKMFNKGERLPDGKHSPAAGHWVEGFLLENYKPADDIWDLGRSLAKTNRRLGFSVEGKILGRGGISKSGAKRVTKAKVRNVAITNCPIHSGTRMEILAKSLQVADNTDDSYEEFYPDSYQVFPQDGKNLLQSIHAKIVNLEKALGMGTAAGINPPSGPQTGEGAGQVITGQSLEQKNKPPRVVEAGSTSKEDDEEQKTKKLDKSGVVNWVRERLPIATDSQIQRFITLTLKHKNRV